MIAGLAVGGLGTVREDLPPAVSGSAAPVSASTPSTPASTPPDARRETFTLPAPGESVQRRLEAGVSHAYAVPSSPGQLLRVVLWEQGADVALRLLSPNGEVLRETEHPGPRAGALLLEALLDPPGEHLLEVTTAGPDARTGLYRLRVEALRQATAEDRARAPLRQQAHRWLDETLVLMQEDREEQTREAIALCEKALDLWRRGEDPFGQAWTLHNLGELYERLGKVEEAYATYLRSQPLWKEIGDPIAQGVAILSADDVIAEKGTAEEAEELLRWSLEAWEREGDLLRKAAALNDLGLVLRRQGRTQEEWEALETALEIRRRQGDPLGQAETLLNMAVALLDSGNEQLRSSLALLDEALSLLELDPDARLETNALISQGVAYRRLGELQKALDTYAKARPLVLRMGSRSQQSLLAHNLGVLYHQLGAWDRALEEYQTALQIAREIGDLSGEGRILRNICWLRYARDELDEALACFESALLHVQTSEKPPDLGNQALVYHGRGVVRASRGDLEGGLQDLTKALGLRRQSSRRAGIPNTLVEIGRVYFELGEIDRARSTLQEAVSGSAELGDQVVHAVALERLARLEGKEGQYQHALDHLEPALEIFDSQRSTLLSSELRASVFAARRSAFELAVELLMKLHEQQPASGYDGQALRASERARARGLVELLAEARVDLRGQLDPNLRQREEDLEDRVTALQQEMAELAADAGLERRRELLAERQRRLEELRQQQAALEVEIRKQDPRYAEIAHPAPLDLAKIQNLLDDQTVLFEYMIGAESSYLFAVTRTGLRAFPVGTNSAELGGLVSQLRLGLQGRDEIRRRQYLQVAWRLYELLISPASSLLAVRKRLLIAPEGKLYQLPFEALLTRPVKPQELEVRSLPFLLREIEVSYVPSATVLASMDEIRSSRPPLPTHDRLELLAFADPLYGPEREAGGRVDLPGPARGGLFDRAGPFPLPRLEGSLREVEEIAGFFPADRVQIYVGAAATETAVKRDPAVKTARRLHFATHGLIDEDEPANTALILSLRDDDEDGFLQLREVFALHLAADLVVLSACDTGLGKEVRGEGLIGLSRGFMYAGASSLVVSLWRADDQATAELMVRFYHGLVGGLDKGEALREAKLGILDDDGPYAYPSFWAPFVLLGR